MNKRLRTKKTVKPKTQSPQRFCDRFLSSEFVIDRLQTQPAHDGRSRGWRAWMPDRANERAQTTIPFLLNTYNQKDLLHNA